MGKMEIEVISIYCVWYNTPNVSPELLLSPQFSSKRTVHDIYSTSQCMTASNLDVDMVDVDKCCSFSVPRVSRLKLKQQVRVSNNNVAILKHQKPKWELQRNWIQI